MSRGWWVIQSGFFASLAPPPPLPNQITPFPFLGSKAKIRFHLQRRHNLQRTVRGHGSTPLQEWASELNWGRRQSEKKGEYCVEYLLIADRVFCPCILPACSSVRAAIHRHAPLSYRGKKEVQLFSAIQSARVSTNLTRSPSFTQFLCLPPSVSHCSGLVPVSTALSCPCSTRHTAQLRTAEADSGVGVRERERQGWGCGCGGGLGGRQGENEHRKLRRKQRKQREG